VGDQPVDRLLVFSQLRLGLVEHREDQFEPLLLVPAQVLVAAYSLIGEHLLYDSLEQLLVARREFLADIMHNRSEGFLLLPPHRVEALETLGFARLNALHLLQVNLRSIFRNADANDLPANALSLHRSWFLGSGGAR